MKTLKLIGPVLAIAVVATLLAATPQKNTPVKDMSASFVKQSDIVWHQ